MRFAALTGILRGLRRNDGVEVLAAPRQLKRLQHFTRSRILHERRNGNIPGLPAFIDFELMQEFADAIELCQLRMRITYRCVRASRVSAIMPR